MYSMHTVVREHTNTSKPIYTFARERIWVSSSQASSSTGLTYGEVYCGGDSDGGGCGFDDGQSGSNLNIKYM